MLNNLLFHFMVNILILFLMSLIKNVSFEMSKKLDSNIDPMCLLKISTIKQMAYFNQYAKNQQKLDITLFKMLPNNY